MGKIVEMWFNAFQMHEKGKVHLFSPQRWVFYPQAYKYGNKSTVNKIQN